MSTDVERIQEEVEALEAILLDDVVIQYNDSGVPFNVKTVIFPSTADDTKQQYVCISLDAKLPSGYPDCEPEIKLHNSRGLDDNVLREIELSVKKKCQEYVGQPVLFELIELIRERLTNSNLPSCHCAVCLYGFNSMDQFTKTQCFHYFHSYCLATHLVSTERHFHEEQDKLPAWQKQTSGFQALCPVCREHISCDLDMLKQAPPPVEMENDRQFEITAELRALQARMAQLFIYQKNRGGIIDLDAEETKLLLVTENNVSDAASDSSVQQQQQDTDSSPGPSLAPATVAGNPATPPPTAAGNNSTTRNFRGFNRYSRGNRGRNSRNITHTR